MSQPQSNPGQDKQTLTVTVENRDRPEKTLTNFDIPKSEKAQDAANRAASQMSLPSSANYRLMFGNATLDPQKPVGSNHQIHDGSTLIFVDLGGGV